jgi:hypothetical protein
MVFRLALLLFIVSMSIEHAAHAELLDGRAYAGSFVVAQTGVRLPEVITFSSGRLKSAAAESFGYADGGYYVRISSGIMNFQAFMDSPRMGWMRWDGYIVEDRLVVRISARDPDEPEEHFSVEARLTYIYELSEPILPGEQALDFSSLYRSGP